MSRSDERRVPLSRTTAAHEIFGALWGILFLGAVSQADGLASAAVVDVDRFVSSRRDRVEDLLVGIRSAAALDDSAMSIFDEGRWNRVDVAPKLSLYSGIYPAPGDIDLSDAKSVGWLIRCGMECQLVDLLGALVRAALALNRDPQAGVRSAIGALETAIDLANGAGARATVADVIRAWRVSELRRLVRPDSGATPRAKADLQGAALALEAWVGGP